jgi:AmmeMemoRadiSam system protein B
MSGFFLTHPIPRLRQLDIKPIQHEGRALLVFRDPLRLSDQMVVLPQEAGGLVAFFDGERDAEGVSAAIAVRFGVRIPAEVIAEVAQAFDDHLMLEGNRVEDAMTKALSEYRALPARAPALAGTAYPEDRELLSRYLLECLRLAGSDSSESVAVDGIRGIISPHIDFSRGGIVYARAWSAARDAVRNAELAVILGTDHYGGDSEITLTRQNYASPLGVLPTATETVDHFAAAVGREASFANEVRHRGEHSVELAAVWLQFLRGSDPLPTVPILLGSIDRFVETGVPPESDPRIIRFTDALRSAIRDRRTLVVVAGDLAHLGPAFGNDPVTESTRALVRSADERLVNAVAAKAGDGLAREFAQHPFHDTVCGLAPFYVAARALEPVSVEWIAYDQCAADAQNTSIVSICGALLI